MNKVYEIENEGLVRKEILAIIDLDGGVNLTKEKNHYQIMPHC